MTFFSAAVMGWPTFEAAAIEVAMLLSPWMMRRRFVTRSNMVFGASDRWLTRR
jgi:hypothetical protein